MGFKTGSEHRYRSTASSILQWRLNNVYHTHCQPRGWSLDRSLGQRGAVNVAGTDTQTRHLPVVAARNQSTLRRQRVRTMRRWSTSSSMPLIDAYTLLNGAMPVRPLSVGR
jgi:hypothetical protein